MVADSDNGRKEALVVLGMHRSGTSAIARVLSLSGATLPAKLMPAGAGNELGHWEPVDVQALNDKVLSGQDSDWSDTFGPRQGHRRRLPTKKYIPEARDILRRNYDSADLIVLKEPRVSLLLDLWKEALAKEGFSAAFIIMVRHPLEVAVSLRTRNNLVENRSIMLWANYMLSCEVGTRDSRRIFVQFDDLIQSPEQVLDRVEAELRVTLPRRTWDSTQEIKEFLVREHKVYLTESQKAEIRRYPEVNILYDYFVAASNGDSWNADVSADAIEWLSKLDLTVGPIVKQLEREIRIQRTRIEEAAERERELLASFETRQSEFFSREMALTTEVERAAAELDLRLRREAELNLEAQQLQTHFAEREVQLRKGLDQALSEVATSSERATTLQLEIARLHNQLDEVGAANQTYLEREVELLDRIERLSEEVESASGRALDAEAALASLQAEWTRQDIQGVKQQLERVYAELQSAVERALGAEAALASLQAEWSSKDIQGLENRLEQIDTERKLAISRASQADAALASMQSALSDQAFHWSGRFDEMARNAEARLAALHEDFSVRKAELEAHLDAANVEAQVAREDARAVLAASEQMSEAHVAREVQLLRQLELSDDDVRKAEGRTTELERQIQEFETRSSMLEQQLLRAHAKQEELNAELERRALDAEAVVRERDKVIRDATAARVSAELRESELSNQRRQTSEEVVKLQQQSAELARALADAVADAQKLDGLSPLELQSRAIKRLFPRSWFRG